VAAAAELLAQKARETAEFSRAADVARMMLIVAEELEAEAYELERKAARRGRGRPKRESMEAHMHWLRAGIGFVVVLALVVACLWIRNERRNRA